MDPPPIPRRGRSAARAWLASWVGGASGTSLPRAQPEEAPDHPRESQRDATRVEARRSTSQLEAVRSGKKLRKNSTEPALLSVASKGAPPRFSKAGSGWFRQLANSSSRLLRNLVSGDEGETARGGFPAGVAMAGLFLVHVQRMRASGVDGQDDEARDWERPGAPALDAGAEAVAAAESADGADPDAAEASGAAPAEIAEAEPVPEGLMPWLSVLEQVRAAAPKARSVLLDATMAKTRLTGFRSRAETLRLVAQFGLGRVVSFPAFYLPLLGYMLSYFIAMAAQSGSRALSTGSATEAIGARVGLLPPGTLGGAPWVPGHLCLALPPQYDGLDTPAKRVAIPLVYAFMHSALAALTLLPLPKCHALWTLLSRAAPGPMRHIPVCDFDRLHKLLGWGQRSRSNRARRRARAHPPPP